MAWDDVRESLIRYCKVDGGDPNDVADLEESYYAAVDYIGVREPKQGTSRWYSYLQCLKYLVLDMFDRRGAKEPSNDAMANISFRQMLVQLKLTELPPEVDP